MLDFVVTMKYTDMVADHTKLVTAIKEGDSKPGDLIGLNLKTGMARRYREGDKFIGIAERI